MVCWHSLYHFRYEFQCHRFRNINITSQLNSHGIYVFLLMLDFLNRVPDILKGIMVVDHKINITNHLNSENRSGKQFSDTFSEVYFLLIV